MLTPIITDVRLIPEVAAARIADSAKNPKLLFDESGNATDGSGVTYCDDACHNVEDLLNRWAAGRAALVAYLRELSSDPEFANACRAAEIDLSEGLGDLPK